MLEKMFRLELRASLQVLTRKKYGVEKKFMNILFWNASIGKKCSHTDQHKDRIEALLVELIIENKADIVVLAEYELDLLKLCNLLAVDGYLYKEGKPINSKCRVKLLLKDELIMNIIKILSIILLLK